MWVPGVGEEEQCEEWKRRYLWSSCTDFGHFKLSVMSPTVLKENNTRPDPVWQKVIVVLTSKCWHNMLCMRKAWLKTSRNHVNFMFSFLEQSGQLADTRVSKAFVFLLIRDLIVFSCVASSSLDRISVWPSSQRATVPFLQSAQLKSHESEERRRGRASPFSGSSLR